MQSGDGEVGVRMEDHRLVGARARARSDGAEIVVLTPRPRACAVRRVQQPGCASAMLSELPGDEQTSVIVEVAV